MKKYPFTSEKTICRYALIKAEIAGPRVERQRSGGFYELVVILVTNGVQGVRLLEETVCEIERDTEQRRHESREIRSNRYLCATYINDKTNRLTHLAMLPTSSDVSDVETSNTLSYSYSYHCTCPPLLALLVLTPYTTALRLHTQHSRTCASSAGPTP
jgi:hypothetical protein